MTNTKNEYTNEQVRLKAGVAVAFIKALRGGVNPLHLFQGIAIVLKAVHDDALLADMQAEGEEFAANYPNSAREQK